MHRNSFELTPIVVQLLNWPFLAFIIVLLFQDELRKLIARIKKAGIFGQEIEFDEIKDFEQSVNSAQEVTPEDPLNLFNPSEPTDNVSKYFKDPQMGIVVISREIEQELRSISASFGLTRDRELKGIRQYFDALRKYGALSEDIMVAVRSFIELRNKIVHGRDVESEVHVIRVLGIALSLLNTLKLISRETHVVHLSNVAVYSDKECKTERTDVKGLILEVSSTEEQKHDYRIYPTTRPDYYKIGEKVSWEWDLSITWKESWYTDPVTKEKKLAWSSAGEFVGRHVKEIE